MQHEGGGHLPTGGAAAGDGRPSGLRLGPVQTGTGGIKVSKTTGGLLLLVGCVF